MEERLFEKEIPFKRYNNLTKEERDAVYSLRDDSTIFIGGDDKGSVVAVWDMEEYLREEYKQIKEKEMYEELQNDLSVLVNTIIKILQKICFRGDLSSD